MQQNSMELLLMNNFTSKILLEFRVILMYSLDIFFSVYQVVTWQNSYIDFIISRYLVLRYYTYIKQCYEDIIL